MADASMYPGLWKFVMRYPATCGDELLRTFSRKLFCKALQRLVPEIRTEDLIPAGAGVRAQAILPNGELVNDFYFLEGPAALHVLNAPSPAATASLAIGDEIAGKILGQFH
jgi:L-2-hydroxyglutarate oxidase LhgO